ncbi:hypothetical protein I3842_08G125100 [Carya illinoinensis]|uniref:Reverse transcriptase zinc-binding domain-containing protein n=1 Tax=Carya illinoinensis TaxID=32201 RepID=A0A922EEJ0_CARIL|nr:hypothetical protein I3842_08G125100 [Carya illinoinensis]
MLWRIGDGETAEMWKDKWLPKQNTFKPQTSIIFLQEDTKWKRELVYSMFTKEEAELILKIPISPSSKPDRQYWRCTSTACLKALPTRANLAKRKVIEDPACPICLQSAETTEHILWECPSARDVWALSNRKLQKASSHSPHFVEMFEHLVDSLGTEEMLTFAITSWNIWKIRNKVVFKGLFTHPSIVVQQTQQLVEDLLQLDLKKKTKGPDQLHNTHWEAPPQGKIKVNWDASVDKVSCKVGVGAIIRDWESKVLATLRMKQDLFPESANVSGLTSKTEDLTYTGLIFADTRDTLNTFNSWSIRHTIRVNNEVAHALSKNALSIRGCTTTFDFIPSCIQTLI